MAAGHGARAVKWLPPAMGIDPASARCDRFYAAAARLGLALLTHAGEEKAVHGAAEHGFGNPLKLRRALLDIQRGTAVDQHGWMHKLG